MCVEVGSWWRARRSEEALLWWLSFLPDVVVVHSVSALEWSRPSLAVTPAFMYPFIRGRVENRDFPRDGCAERRS